jgi:hypothetical protein
LILLFCNNQFHATTCYANSLPPVNLPRPSLLLPAILVAALLLHVILLVDLPILLQGVAALLLTGLLPGLFLVDLLLGRSDSPPSRGEFGLYAIAAGYALIIVIMLLLSYLPGGLTQWMILATFDGVLALLLILWWRREQHSQIDPQISQITRIEGRAGSITFAKPSQRQVATIAGLLILLLVGGYLRFANLGYAEFHGDEARGALRAAALLQGHEEVLFLHKKGPTEIVLPALLLALTGGLTEAVARLPLALANLAALCAIWALGWRLRGPLAGWLAAFLLAFDGYLIAFSRFLQYQSVVLLTSILVVLILVCLWQAPKALGRYLTLAALLWATGLLSHYDAVTTAVPVVVVFVALLWQRRVPWRTLVRATIPAVLLGGGLLALFYLPYLLHPRFQSTVTYLMDQRFVAGQRFPYNGLFDLIRRSLVYNSSDYLLLMITALALALVLTQRQRRLRLFWAGVSILLVALAGWTLWDTTWLRLGSIDYAFVPFTLACLWVWLTPQLPFAQRLLWIWLGALLLLSCFGVALARTHIYIFFAPWALLVGLLLADGWHALQRRLHATAAVALGTVAVVAALVRFGGYDYWYFVQVLKTWPAHTAAGYWTPPYTKEVDSLYGFPLSNGWKVIGALYAEGALQGPYETNQRYEWIPSWYTLGQERCASTANWYFAVDTLESWSLRSADVEDLLEEQGYRRWGQVTVGGDPRLVIYRQGAADDTPIQTFPLERYAPRFDAAMQATLPLRSPIVEDPIPNPLHLNFNNEIWLEGYQLELPDALEPGDTFRLTLYWRGQRSGLPSYKVFNQAFYGDGIMVAQKDAIPVCDREVTTNWDPGELIVDTHEIPIADDAPPGVYPLYTGLYNETDLSRVPILDAAGAITTDAVHLADLTIVAR